LRDCTISFVYDNVSTTILTLNVLTYNDAYAVYNMCIYCVPTNRYITLPCIKQIGFTGAVHWHYRMHVCTHSHIHTQTHSPCISPTILYSVISVRIYESKHRDITQVGSLCLEDYLNVFRASQFPLELNLEFNQPFLLIVPLCST